MSELTLGNAYGIPGLQAQQYALQQQNQASMYQQYGNQFYSNGTSAAGLLNSYTLVGHDYARGVVHVRPDPRTPDEKWLDTRVEELCVSL